MPRAAFAYQGHAGSIKDIEEKRSIAQIETDEWNHRREILEIKTNKLLPFFEKLFSWGKKGGFNNVDLDKKYPMEKSDVYCKK